MDSDTCLPDALEKRRTLRVYANPPALRTSDSDPENSGTEFRAAPPRAHSGDYDRTRRDRACIRPASLRPNAQRANGQDRARERWLLRDPHLDPTREQWCG